MGTKLAPALATIYIGDLEEPFLAHREFKPDLWVRYIDYVFMVWPHPLVEFGKFLTDLNSYRERIKFTAETCNYRTHDLREHPQS